MAILRRIHRRVATSTTLKVGVGVVAAVAISVPTAVWATDRYSDVPTTHPFHGEIGAVSDAGIARGFPDGTYRPGANITRGAMAAFLERGLARVATDHRSTTTGPGSARSLAGSVTMQAGAAGAGNGFVVVEAHVTAHTFSAWSCPCPVALYLYAHGAIVRHTYFDIGAPNEHGYAAASASIAATRPIGADQTHTYEVWLHNDDTGASVHATTTLTAVYVPLSGDGDNTL